MSKLFLALGMLLALGAAGCRESSEKSGSMTEQSTSAGNMKKPSRSGDQDSV